MDLVTSTEVIPPLVPQVEIDEEMDGNSLSHDPLGQEVAVGTDHAGSEVARLPVIASVPANSASAGGDEVDPGESPSAGNVLIDKVLAQITATSTEGEGRQLEQEPRGDDVRVEARSGGQFSLEERVDLLSGEVKLLREEVASMKGMLMKIHEAMDRMRAGPSHSASGSIEDKCILFHAGAMHMLSGMVSGGLASPESATDPALRLMPKDL